MRRRRPRHNPQIRSNLASRGIALVAVLWAVMLLALMAQSFTSDVRTGTQLTQNLVANSEARALADAAVHMAIGRLISERSDPNRVFDGSPYRTTIGGADVEISVQDESGKIDLNRAPDALLDSLFLWAGLTPDGSRAVVDAIADWRDRDSLRRVNGAEESEYRLANRGYGPKNQAFDSIEELRLVLGITPTLFAKIRPAITVNAQRRGVDLRVATAAVLAILLGDDARAQEVLEARKEGSLATVVAGTTGVPKTLTARSPRTTFTIRATVNANGATFTREAVIRLASRTARPFTTLAWRHGASTSP